MADDGSLAEASGRLHGQARRDHRRGRHRRQAMPIIAETAAHLTVFQRTPNYVIPARNHALDDARRRASRRTTRTSGRFRRSTSSPSRWSPRTASPADVTPEERDRIFEAAWQRGGFGYIFETFDDILVDERSNEAAAEFIREKDPGNRQGSRHGGAALPEDVSTGRQAAPTRAWLLRDVQSRQREAGRRQQEPDPRDHSQGVADGDGRVRARHDHLRDRLRCCDRRTHADRHPRTAGQSLKDKWAAGPKTYLGIGVHGFPNMFLICGPQSPFANIPVVIDNVVRWIGRAITRLRAGGLDRFEAEARGRRRVERAHGRALASHRLPRGEDVGSWFLGANIPGKPHVVLFYFGGAGAYFDQCREVADRDFEGFAAA